MLERIANEVIVAVRTVFAAGSDDRALGQWLEMTVGNPRIAAAFADCAARAGAVTDAPMDRRTNACALLDQLAHWTADGDATERDIYGSVYTCGLIGPKG
jgi:hypothetical protein